MPTLRNVVHTLPDVSAVEVIILSQTTDNQANYLANALSVEETIQQTIRGVPSKQPPTIPQGQDCNC
jgi:hypothetical protein